MNKKNMMILMGFILLFQYGMIVVHAMSYENYPEEIIKETMNDENTLEETTKEIIDLEEKENLGTEKNLSSNATTRMFDPVVVTLVVNNGAKGVYASQMIQFQIERGTSIPASYIPAYAARRGWYFAGWHLDGNPNHPIEFGNIYDDKLFIAKFNNLFWYFTFYIDEGGVYEGRTYRRERDGHRLPNNHMPGTLGPMSIPSVEALPGWIFIGWYYGGSYLGTPDLYRYIINYSYDFTGDRVFRARFERIEDNDYDNGNGDNDYYGSTGKDEEEASENNNVVQTSDVTNASQYMALLFLSGFLILKQFKLHFQKES